LTAMFATALEMLPSELNVDLTFLCLVTLATCAPTCCS
jgi:hypothetical protein